MGARVTVMQARILRVGLSAAGRAVGSPARVVGDQVNSMGSKWVFGGTSFAGGGRPRPCPLHNLRCETRKPHREL